MLKLVPVLLGVALLAAGVAAAQELTSSPDEVPTVSVGTTTAGTTTDEETTTDAATTTDGGVTTTRPEPGEDVSGPCDEAEHANDTRCAGGTPREDDRSGRRDGDADDADHDDENRSGSNSGRG